MNIEFGTKVFNHQTKEIGILIKIWKNKFADDEVDVLDISVDYKEIVTFLLG